MKKVLCVLFLLLVLTGQVQAETYDPTDSVLLTVGTVDTTFLNVANVDSVWFYYGRVSGTTFTQAGSSKVTASALPVKWKDGATFIKKIKASCWVGDSTGTMMAVAHAFKSGCTGIKTWSWLCVEMLDSTDMASINREQSADAQSDSGYTASAFETLQNNMDTLIDANANDPYLDMTLDDYRKMNADGVAHPWIYDEGILLEGLEDTSAWVLSGTGAGKDEETSFIKEGNKSIRLVSTDGNAAVITYDITDERYMGVSNFTFWCWSDTVNRQLAGIYPAADFPTELEYIEFRIGKDASAWTNYFFHRFKDNELPSDWSKLIFLRAAMEDQGTISWEDDMARIGFVVKTRDAGDSVGFCLDGLFKDRRGRGAVVIRWDDGLATQYDTGFAIMQARGLRASLCTESEDAGITWPEFREMYRWGFDIGCHGIDGAYAAESTEVAIRRRLHGAWAEIMAQGMPRGVIHHGWAVDGYDTTALKVIKEDNKFWMASGGRFGLYNDHLSLEELEDHATRCYTFPRRNIGASDFANAHEACYMLDTLAMLGTLGFITFHGMGVHSGIGYHPDSVVVVMDHLDNMKGVLDCITPSEYLRQHYLGRYIAERVEDTLLVVNENTDGDGSGGIDYDINTINENTDGDGLGGIDFDVNSIDDNPWDNSKSDTSGVGMGDWFADYFNSIFGPNIDNIAVFSGMPTNQDSIIRIYWPPDGTGNKDSVQYLGDDGSPLGTLIFRHANTDAVIDSTVSRVH